MAFHKKPGRVSFAENTPARIFNADQDTGNPNSKDVVGKKKKRSASPSEPEAGATSKRPSVSDSKASKSSGLPDLDLHRFISLKTDLMLLNDPKACKEFVKNLVTPAEKERAKAMTDAKLWDGMFTSFASLAFLPSEIQKLENQLKFYMEKQCSTDAHSRELETAVASLEEKLVSSEKETIELNFKLDVSSMELGRWNYKVKELNTKVDRLNDTLKAKDEQLSAKEAAWTSEKDALMSTVESLGKQIQQLEGEKSTVADDRNWLISEGFKHVVDKLRTSDELLKLIGEVNTRASHVGFQEGLKAGYRFSKIGVPMESTACYDPNARAKLVRATQDFEGASFPYLEKLAACADAPLESLKSVVPHKTLDGLLCLYLFSNCFSLID